MPCTRTGSHGTSEGCSPMPLHTPRVLQFTAGGGGFSSPHSSVGHMLNALCVLSPPESENEWTSSIRQVLPPYRKLLSAETGCRAEFLQSTSWLPDSSGLSTGRIIYGKEADVKKETGFTSFSESEAQMSSYVF